MTRLWPAYLAVAVATVVWGTLHPVGKVILQEATPLQLVLARTLCTATALSALLAALGRLGRVWDEIRLRPARVAGLGMLSFVLSSGLSMAGLALLPASINSLLSNTSPLMLAVGVVFVDRRLPRARVLVGLLVGFAGVALLVQAGAAGLGAVGLLGVLLSLTGALAWAAYTGWSRRALSATDPLALTVAASLVGVGPLGLLAVATGDIGRYAALSTDTLLLLLYAGVLGTAFTYALWMTALGRLPATNVAAFQYVIPLTAVVLAVALLGEPLTPQLIGGGLLILVGVGLAQERVR